MYLSAWLPEILAYPFMVRAFIVGITVALLSTCIGLVIVLRRLSMVGDALAHTSLAGVTIGLIAGFNPILGAMGSAVTAAFAIEYLRKAFHKYSELSIAIVMSAGIGLAGNLSCFVTGVANFNSFLFGSIVAIDDFEFKLIIVIGAAVLLLSLLFYKELFYITFDEEGAFLAGLPVSAINRMFTVLTALTIAIASRTVGSLVISSLLIIPVATALQLARSYRSTLFISMGLSVLYTVAGLITSFYLDLKPGASIVLISVAGLVIVIVGKKLFHHRHSLHGLIKDIP